MPAFTGSLRQRRSDQNNSPPSDTYCKAAGSGIASRLPIHSWNRSPRGPAACRFCGGCDQLDELQYSFVLADQGVFKEASSVLPQTEDACRAWCGEIWVARAFWIYWLSAKYPDISSDISPIWLGCGWLAVYLTLSEYSAVTDPRASRTRCCR